MLAKQTARLADAMVESGTVKPEDKDIIAYGLSAAIEIASSIATTLALGFLFGRVLHSLVFLGAFSFLRTYAGGYHCEKASHCYWSSSGIVALALALVRFVPTRFLLPISAILMLLAIPTILHLAPVPAPHKPLDDIEKRHYRKKTIVHLCVLCTIAGLLFQRRLQDFAFAVCLAISVSAGLVYMEYRDLQI